MVIKSLDVYKRQDLNNYEIIKIYGLKKAVIEKQRLVLRGLNKFDGMAVYLRRKNVNK